MRSADFFAFIKEREQIRRRKAAGLSKPWTDDVILQNYKFTNVFRHFDTTSMELRNRFYSPNFHDDRRSILMNCALFRYFGTWEFASVVGWQDYDSFDFEGIKELAKERLKNRQRVFTGAYVITNQGISAPKQEVVVDTFLKGLHRKTPEILELAARTQKWQQVAREMMKIIGFGGSGFMAKEILVDTTYTGFWEEQKETEDAGSFSFPDDWYDWTPVGPGARRGAARFLGDDSAKPVSFDKAFDCIMYLLDESKIGDDWPDEFGELCAHDIQFQLCEFDKYERVRLGQGKPRSRYNGV